MLEECVFGKTFIYVSTVGRKKKNEFLRFQSASRQREIYEAWGDKLMFSTAKMESEHMILIRLTTSQAYIITMFEEWLHHQFKLKWWLICGWMERQH